MASCAILFIVIIIITSGISSILLIFDNSSPNVCSIRCKCDVRSDKVPWSSTVNNAKEAQTVRNEHFDGINFCMEFDFISFEEYFCGFSGRSVL